MNLEKYFTMLTQCGMLYKQGPESTFFVAFMNKFIDYEFIYSLVAHHGKEKGPIKAVLQFKQFLTLKSVLELVKFIFRVYANF